MDAEYSESASMKLAMDVAPKTIAAQQRLLAILYEEPPEDDDEAAAVFEAWQKRVEDALNLLVRSALDDGFQFALKGLCDSCRAGVALRAQQIVDSAKRKGRPD